MNKAIFKSTVLYDTILTDFLRDNIKESKNSIKNMIINNCVYVNSCVVNKSNYILHNGDEIVVILRQIRDKNYSIDIIYEDQYFIGINKPNGLLSISTIKSDYTAYQLVRSYVNKKREKLFVLHRLDRDTSGILLFCKDNKIKEYMQNNWDQLVLKRGYILVCNGILKGSGTIRSYLYEDKNYNVKSTNNSKLGKLAITHYNVLSNNKKYSLVQVFLDTGRKNQIRVHMCDIGHSILGDKKYGNIKSDRLYLHSNIFEFIHPITKKNVYIESFNNFSNHF